jgi:hypothetical protein
MILLVISYHIQENTKTMYALYDLNISSYCLLLFSRVPCIKAEHYFISFAYQGGVISMHLLSSMFCAKFLMKYKKGEKDYGKII